VTLPMSIAPLLIAVTSHESTGQVFTTPQERATPAVIAAYRDSLRSGAAPEGSSHDTIVQPA
jgi:membrane glycosyltransferase